VIFMFAKIPKLWPLLHSTTPTLTLEIIPCIDSLLYAPIYLAVASLCSRNKVIDRSMTADESKVQLSVGSSMPGLKTIEICYKRAANGDKNVISHVTYDQDQPGTLRIGLCDPLSVLNENCALNKDDRESWTSPHRIHAVFIDKINLSLCVRRPRETPDEHNRERERQLSRIISELNAQEINYPGRFARDEVGRPTVCQFWDHGETTKFIVEHFLKFVGGGYVFRPAPKPDHDLTPLAQGEVDLAITHAPWALDLATHRADVHVFTRECFPGIQFPFSCVLTPELPATSEIGPFHVLLTELLQAVRAAILLLHYNPIAAKTILLRYVQFFRNYGLGDGGLAEASTTRAVHHFSVAGCFSSDLIPDWTSWLQAFWMDKDWSARVRDGTAWKALEASLNSDVSEQLRNRMQAFIPCVERYDDLSIHATYRF
jgi:hypothetical protein